MKLQLAEIEAVQRGIRDEFLRISCTWLRLTSSHLDPADFAERADEVQQLLGRSRTKLAEFEKDDLPCGTKPAGAPLEPTAPAAHSS